MTELQKQLQDIVLASPEKFNLEKLHILLDTDWETEYKSGYPPFSEMVPLQEWLMPFQVKFTDEERKLVEDAVKKWGLVITSDYHPSPSHHTIGFNDESEDTRGFIAKVAMGDHILDKAKGNVTKYTYNYIATAGNYRFITQSCTQQEWSLQETLDYIGGHIKPDNYSPYYH